MADSAVERADEVEALRRELAEAREALDAIRTGRVDALLVSTPEGQHLFTLEGSDFAYRALVEQMEEGAATLNGRGIVLFANQSLARMLGRPLDVVVGKPFADFVDEPDRASFQESLDACAECGTSSRTEVMLASELGAPVPVSFSLRAFDVYGTPTLSMTVVDLTTHKALARAEANREVDERYRLAVRATQDSIWDLELVTGDVRANEAHDAMIGVRPAGVSGLQWWTDRLHPEDRDRVLASFGTALDGSGDEWRCEYRLKRVDGSWAVVFDRANVSRDRSGKAVRVIGAMQDLTESRAREETIRNSEALFRAVATSTTEFAIYLKDRESRLVYLNPFTERLLGKPASAVLGRTDREFYDDPAIGDAILEHDRQIMADGLPISFEEVIETATGIRTMLSSKVPWRDGAGDIVGLIGISRDITEWKRAEHALRESEERFRMALRNAPVSVAVQDLDLRYTWAFNQRTATPDQIIGHTDADIFTPAEAAHVTAMKRRVLTEGIEHREQMWFRRPGGPIFLDVCFEPLRDAAGRIVGVGSATVDLTPMKLAEESARLSERKFVRAFANNPAAIALSRLDDGLIVEVNETWEALTGHRREEVTGRSDRNLGLWPSQEDAARFVRELNDKGVVRGWEQEFHRKSGEAFVAQLSAQLIASGGEQLILSTLVDVTERKRYEEVQRESEEELRLLAWTAGNLLSAPDPQAFVEELCREVMAHLGCDVFFNFLADEATARLHMTACAGVPDADARRMEWLDYGVAVCGCVARDRQRIIAEDIACSDDPRTALVKSFGVQAYCCHPILAQGRLLGTLSFGTRTRPRFTEREVETMRTVTDQVAAAMQRVVAEKALRGFSATLEQRVAERTSEVQALVVRLRELARELTEAELRERRRVARILHDHFQQILVAAKLQVGVLLARVRAEQLRAAAQQTDELLTEAIQAARTLAVELSPPILHDAGLAAGLEWLRQRMLQQHNLQVHVTADAQIDPGSDDVRAFVYESIRELLFNVVKHAGVREARLGVRRRDGEIEVVVEDDGVGLGPGPVPNPFRNQVPTGTGLFSIAQRLELLGGSLSFEKAGGQGTRVKLGIPVEDLPDTGPSTPAPQAPLGAARPGRGAQKIRVLLADDHRIVRQGFAALIRSDEEVEVVGEAANGAEAIELARLLLPDVVVMDVSMPKMNGIDATRWLTVNLPRVRVIGLSMHEDEPVALAMRDAGAVAFVTKDGPSAALMAAIHAARPGRLRATEQA